MLYIRKKEFHVNREKKRNVSHNKRNEQRATTFIMIGCKPCTITVNENSK